jgi:hypothetical protein
MLSLNEKELAHALFYSIKKNDFEHALYLLSLDAPVNTSFFIDQENLVYTTSTIRFTLDLLVGKSAEAIKKNGVSHSKSQLLLKILDKFI